MLLQAAGRVENSANSFWLLLNKWLEAQWLKTANAYTSVVRKSSALL